jgi:hypothetical protein
MTVAFEIVSDRPPTGWDRFMMETMSILEETGARRIGVFAVLEDGGHFADIMRWALETSC